jgi:hypothetical protein
MNNKYIFCGAEAQAPPFSEIKCKNLVVKRQMCLDDPVREPQMY